MSLTTWQSNILPAQLSYLAIYNPSLGPTDETFDQQLLFYYSRASAEARSAQRRGGKAQDASELVNEQLRQIGLAQGLVDFARSFSNGEPVDSVETEKSRIVLHQLENDWWILASIHLTRINNSSPPSAASKSAKSVKSDRAVPQYEYSSREVSPPTLLVQQIKQAHHIFTLHHAPSLDVLYSKLPRDRFCSTLERFWARFAKSWDVLLHGNPAVDALAGIKLASGGELGFGVGEEAWGSASRDVLEDITRHTEGLVDTIVARFGDPASTEDSQEAPWMGAGSYPSASDGVVFGGVHNITRQSLQSVSLWMRHIYTYGEHAYGVRDNPSRERKRRRRRNISEQIPASDIPSARPAQLSRTRSSSRSTQRAKSQKDTVDLSFMPKDNRPQMHDRVASQDHAPGTSTPRSLEHPNIPPPIVSAAEASLNAATKGAEQSNVKTDQEDNTTLGIPDQYLKYLTLGLSTLAKPSKPLQPPSLSRASTSSSETLVPHRKENIDQGLSMLEPIPDGDALKAKVAMQKQREDKGHFIIGLLGDLDAVKDDEEAAELTEGSLHGQSSEGHRTIVRTVYVHTHQKAPQDDDSDGTVENTPGTRLSRLRVLIYAHRPFLYCFLFEQRTSSLSYTTFYRNIHQNLMPIHKPLITSTRPDKVAERINDANTQQGASHGFKPSEPNSQDVYDLLFDPLRLTVHASIPNIPEPGSLAAEGIFINARHRQATTWTRLDALNVHSAILNALNDSSRRKNDLERTDRTSRNWWITWMKLPASDQLLKKASGESNAASADPEGRIAVIVRKASESHTSHQVSTGSRATSGMWASLSIMSRTEDMNDKETGLSSGIGFDARRYIEGLLSLNR